MESKWFPSSLSNTCMLIDQVREHYSVRQGHVTILQSIDVNEGEVHVSHELLFMQFCTKWANLRWFFIHFIYFLLWKVSFSSITGTMHNACHSNDTGIKPCIDALSITSTHSPGYGQSDKSLVYWFIKIKKKVPRKSLQILLQYSEMGQNKSCYIALEGCELR